MDIRNRENAMKLPLPVDAWKLLGSENIEIINIKLKPNECVDNHINSLDVIFYVLSGNGNIEINGTRKNMVKGDCVFVNKNNERGWFNSDEGVLNLLVIKIL